MNSIIKTYKIFFLIALLQLALLVYPAYVWQDIASSGTECKFLVNISTPKEVLHGYYLSLTFPASKFLTTEQIPKNKKLYALLTTGNDGFCKISALEQTPPANNNPYFISKLNYQHNNELHLYIPFNKYYINERTAKNLEHTSASVSYVLVALKNGRGIIKQVYIDDSPLIN